MSSTLKVSYFVDVDNEELSGNFDDNFAESYVLEVASKIATTLALDIGSMGYTTNNTILQNSDLRIVDISRNLINALDKLEVNVEVSKIDDPVDADLIFTARQETWEDALENRIEELTLYDGRDDWEIYDEAADRVDRSDFTEYDEEGDEVEFDEWGYDQALEEAVTELREERIQEEEEELRGNFELTLYWLYEHAQDDVAMEVGVQKLNWDKLVLKLFQQAYPDRKLSLKEIKEAYNPEDPTFSFDDHIDVYEELSAYDANQLSEGESTGSVIWKGDSLSDYGITYLDALGRVLMFLETEVQYTVSLQRSINDPLKDVITKSDLIERVKFIEDETLSEIQTLSGFRLDGIKKEAISKLESRIILNERYNNIELSFNELFYRGESLKSEDCLVFFDKATKTLNIDSPELEMFGQPLTCQIFLGGIVPFDIFADCENLIISNTHLLFTRENEKSFLPFYWTNLSYYRKMMSDLLAISSLDWVDLDKEWVMRWSRTRKPTKDKYWFEDDGKVISDLYKYVEFVEKPEEIKRFLKKQRNAKLVNSQTHISSIAFLYNLLFLHNETALDSLTIIGSTLDTTLSKYSRKIEYPYETQVFVDKFEGDKNSKINSNYRTDIPALVIKGNSSNIKSLRNLGSKEKRKGLIG